MADSGWCMFFIHSFPPSTKTILAAIQLVVWLLKVVNNIFVLGGILIGFDIKSGRIHQRLWFRLYSCSNIWFTNISKLSIHDLLIFSLCLIDALGFRSFSVIFN